jgi:integrase/recombinase XerD
MPALHLVRTTADRTHVGRSAGEPPAGDLIEQWSNYLTAYGCSAKTVDTYVRAVSGLMHHADVEPLELTRTHVIAWLGRPLKQWTRLSYWKAVRRFSVWLREFGHDPDSDLTRGIPKPRKPAPVARPVSDDLVDKLLALKLGPRAHVYVRLALFQALRVHEIAALKAEDFDLDAGWLMVKGKGGDSAMIPIHSEIAKLAANMPPRGWWFPGQSGVGHGRHRDRPRKVRL